MAIDMPPLAPMPRPSPKFNRSPLAKARLRQVRGEESLTERVQRLATAALDGQLVAHGGLASDGPELGSTMRELAGSARQVAARAESLELELEALDKRILTLTSERDCLGREVLEHATAAFVWEHEYEGAASALRARARELTDAVERWEQRECELVEGQQMLRVRLEDSAREHFARERALTEALETARAKSAAFEEAARLPAWRFGARAALLKKADAMESPTA